MTVFSDSLAIIKIGLDPVLMRVGPFAIHWYGLMYVLGISLGLWIMLPYAERRGFSRNFAYDVFWPALIGGLIGGRLYYVAQSNLGWYLQHPQNILATWEGGMAFYGAIAGAALGIYIVTRLRHASYAAALDCAAVFAPVAQAIGRLGNLVNGDIIGYPSNLPFATEYTNAANTFVPSHHVAYQPAAAYELLFSLALFGIVWGLRFRFRMPGSVFALWVLLYSVGQFFLFFGRANTIVLLGLKQAQLTALVVIVVTIPGWLLWRHVYDSRKRTMEQNGTGAPQVDEVPSLARY